MVPQTSNPIQAVYNGRIWTPTGFVQGRMLRLVDGRVQALAPDRARPPAGLDAQGGYVIPGLVDLQVNGALGWSFQAVDAEHHDAIVAYHVGRGTTTLLPTIITAPTATLTAGLAQLARFIRQHRGPGLLPGVHLEGPFLAPEKSGAHDAGALREPDPALVDALLAAAAGQLRLCTLAPELPGALELIERLVDRGVVVAAGHSAARFEEMRAGVEAGLRLVTHAGNASDWPHRAPGPYGFMASEPGVVGALMALPDLAGSIIMDGFHVHPALLEPLAHLKGPNGILLVSDASTVAGCGPGVYSGGGLEVEVHPAGYATSGRGGGWLAGSTITLLDAVQRAVTLAGLPLETAVHMATLGPARLLGLETMVGHFAPGARADLLVLDGDLELRAVVSGGEPVGG